MPAQNTRAARVVFFLLGVTGSARTSLAADCLTWEERVTSPDARFDHALAYDNYRGVTVLYGGWGLRPHEGAFDDTWEWNGERWTLRATSGPGPRAGHAIAFDSDRGVTVLFGGHTWDGGARETWEWDGAQWTRANDDGPADLFEVQLAFDLRRGITVLYGTDRATWEAQMWGWDGLSWAILNTDPPSPGYPYKMVFDDVRGVIVLVSPYAWPLSQTWEWDGSTWHLRDEGGLLPKESDFSGFALAFDAGRGVTVLHGGRYGSTSPRTWEWDGSVWTRRLQSVMPGREDHALAHDSNGV